MRNLLNINIRYGSDVPVPMTQFFKAYKRYIIHHPKRMQYKPTADKAFDKRKLYDVYKEIIKDVEPKEEDCALIYDFVRISQYLH